MTTNCVYLVLLIILIGHNAVMTVELSNAKEGAASTTTTTVGNGNTSTLKSNSSEISKGIDATSQPTSTTTTMSNIDSSNTDPSVSGNSETTSSSETSDSAKGPAASTTPNVTVTLPLSSVMTTTKQITPSSMTTAHNGTGAPSSGSSGPVKAPPATTSSVTRTGSDTSGTSVALGNSVGTTQNGSVTTPQAPATSDPGSITTISSISTSGVSTVAPTTDTADISTVSKTYSDTSGTSVAPGHSVGTTQNGSVTTPQAPATSDPGSITTISSISTSGVSTVAPTTDTADISTVSKTYSDTSGTSVAPGHSVGTTQNGSVTTPQAPATSDPGSITTITSTSTSGVSTVAPTTDTADISTVSKTYSDTSGSSITPDRSESNQNATTNPSESNQNVTTNPSVSSDVETKDPANQSTGSTNPPRTTSTTTVTVRATTTGLQDSYVKKADSDISIPMELSVNATFTPALEKPDSPLYKEYEKNFTEYLTALYNGTEGFNSINVTGFRNGSIVALFEVEMKVVTTISHTLDTVIETVNARIGDETLSNRLNLDVEANKTLKLVKARIAGAENICILYHKPCDFGYSCKPHDPSHYKCESKCFKRNKHCGQNGDCVINYSDGEAKCRCRSDDTHAYSGEFCEISTEKLKLETKYIIIIGASGGAAFLVIIVVLVVCLLKVRSRNNRAKRGRKGGDKPDSHSMTDFNSLGSFEVLRSRTFTEDNQYDSGLPGTRVLKENSGSETYIYSPTSFAKKVDMADSRERRFNRSDSEYNYIETENAYVYSPTSFTRRSDTIDSDDRRSNRTGSVYDQIDTESKFEIKRPNFRAPLYPQM